MIHNFLDKEYPAITVQSVLLASSILYLEHGGLNLAVIFTVVIILSLFVLQAINHRFFYYFPGNRFTGKETKNLDTFILYFMTFLAFLLFIWGVSHSFVIAIISVVIIISPGFIWRIFFYEKVRDNIVKKLSTENIIEFIKCPKCGAKARKEKRVLKWNKGYLVIECDGCKYRIEKEIPLKIG
jgi:hypothetical protein